MVSIIIPNYNGIKYINNCLESIPKDSEVIGEIIVIDNASTDADYSYIEEKYPHILWKQLDQNYGFSRAVNEGIQMAKEKYVLLLNNDTVLYPNFTDKLVEAIEQDKHIFSVCSQMLRYDDPTRIDDAGDEYTVLGWAYKREDGALMHQEEKIEDVFSACAGAALYRKKVFEEIGYFDETFFAYMEDVDISYRARVYGYKNKYCSAAKVLHIGSATSGSKYNTFKVRLAARNNIYVPYKNMPLIQLIINLPFLALGTLVKYLFFIRKGFEKDYREGVIEGFKTLRQVKKIPFKMSHLGNYFKIEGMLLKNTWKYVAGKLSR